MGVTVQRLGHTMGREITSSGAVGQGAPEKGLRACVSLRMGPQSQKTTGNVRRTHRLSIDRSSAASLEIIPRVSCSLCLFYPQFNAKSHECLLK